MSLLNTLLKADNGISFAAPWDVQEPKNFQLLGGGFAPWPPTRDSASGPRWGLRPQTPVIGSRSTRSPWPQPLLAPPTFKHFQRPCPYDKNRDTIWQADQMAIHVPSVAWSTTVHSDMIERQILHHLARRRFCRPWPAWPFDKHGVSDFPLLHCIAKVCLH